MTADSGRPIGVVEFGRGAAEDGKGDRIWGVASAEFDGASIQKGLDIFCAFALYCKTLKIQTVTYTATPRPTPFPKLSITRPGLFSLRLYNRKGEEGLSSRES